MGRIEVVSAGAGTGKTHKLAGVLLEAIRDHGVRPEAVLAVTFTRKAAAELAGRVRTRLLEEGLVEHAHRLDAARIGTVNAVCGGLTAEFAFELGISPAVRVLDEDRSAAVLDEVMSAVMGGGELVELTKLGRRMQEPDWGALVRSVVQKARINGIDVAGLEGSRVQSASRLMDVFPREPLDSEALEAELEAHLVTFIERAPQADDTKKTQSVVSECRGFLSLLERREIPSWGDWHKLATLEAGRRSDDLLTPVRDTAWRCTEHPLFRKDLKDHIDLVFGLATRVMDAYVARKEALGVIDFVDQERRVLDLLQRDEIRKRLAVSVDLVLIDEFQDTSPIQLAIFLALAGLAPRSVWVGDQKQSIFGFRDADPELMETCIRHIESITGSVERLDVSYRSRPGLVDLTSELFARAFADQGLPAERVCLRPYLEEDPAGLGDWLEIWWLGVEEGRANKDKDACSIAWGVSELLKDRSERVRGQESGKNRSIEAEDIGMLCPDNASCERIAEALESLGIPVRLSYPGLLQTAEARLILAGLRLWSFQKDLLAAAEVVRLTADSGDEIGWLNLLLTEDAADQLRSRPAVASLLNTRKSNLMAGPLQAYDLVSMALGVRERCLEWGHARRRSANLDVLRAHVMRYVTGETDIGREVTVTGLLMELESLGRDPKTVWGGRGKDLQAAYAGPSAVTVSTMHSAKGLEWPVTILYGLDHPARSTLLGLYGIQVVGDPSGPDLSDVLKDRWIRYWPDPFGPSQKNTPLAVLLEETPTGKQRQQQAESELLRLLYVSWTRARDKLVLAMRPKTLGQGMIGFLRDPSGNPLGEPDEVRVRWTGDEIPVRVRTLLPKEPESVRISPDTAPMAQGPRPYPPASVPASASSGEGDAGPWESIGPGIDVTGVVDVNDLGDAFHAIAAADTPDSIPGERRDQAERILGRWGLSDHVEAGQIIKALDALYSWVEARWPGCVMKKEYPVMMRSEVGTRIGGFVDLVVDSGGSLIVVDHKTHRITTEQIPEVAVQFAGQLGAYRDILQMASGKPVAGTFIHLPMIGVILSVECHSWTTTPLGGDIIT